jgi:hypothetical protein
MTGGFWPELRMFGLSTCTKSFSSSTPKTPCRAYRATNRFLSDVNIQGPNLRVCCHEGRIGLNDDPTETKRISCFRSTPRWSDQLTPGHAYLIPKGLELKVESHYLRKLAVVFDQKLNEKGSIKSSE